MVLQGCPRQVPRVQEPLKVQETPDMRRVGIIARARAGAGAGTGAGAGAGAGQEQEQEKEQERSRSRSKME